MTQPGDLVRRSDVEAAARAWWEAAGCINHRAGMERLVAAIAAVPGPAPVRAGSIWRRNGADPSEEPDVAVDTTDRRVMFGGFKPLDDGAFLARYHLVQDAVDCPDCEGAGTLSDGARCRRCCGEGSVRADSVRPICAVAYSPEDSWAVFRGHLVGGEAEAAWEDFAEHYEWRHEGETIDEVKRGHRLHHTYAVDVVGAEWHPDIDDACPEPEATSWFVECKPTTPGAFEATIIEVVP